MRLVRLPQTSLFRAVNAAFYADGDAGIEAMPVSGAFIAISPSCTKVASRTLILCPSVLFLSRITSGRPISRAIPVALFLAEKTLQMPLKWPLGTWMSCPFLKTRGIFPPFEFLSSRSLGQTFWNGMMVGCGSSATPKLSGIISTPLLTESLPVCKPRSFVTFSSVCLRVPARTHQAHDANE
jgi:hypothetical protein